jgi:hypothetical protein
MNLPPADTVHEGRCRLEEMKVEMAWLASPITFPYPLAARTVDDKLEVRGSVPRDGARDAAMQIARVHTHLPVVNALQINRDLPAPESGVGTDAIRQGVVEVLTDTFGPAARGFDIRVAGDGQVAVSGSVNSVEEKLAVSRRLRKVRGCTSASNYLQISPVMRDGRMVTQINLNGSLVVSGQVLCLDGTGQETSSPHAAVTSMTGTPVQTMTVAPRTVPAAVTMPQKAASAVGMPPPPPTLPPVVRTAALPVPPAPPPAQPVIPASVPPAPTPPAVPDAVMPIQVPVPATPPPPPTLLVPPCPSRVTEAPAKPATPAPQVKAPVVLPPSATVPAAAPVVVLPRDPSTARQGTPVAVTIKPSGPTPLSGKGVDLLAVPTVPQSWTRDAAQPAPATPATAQKSTAATKFATARAEPSKTRSTDELLNLPAVPLGAGKPSGSVVSTPAPVRPATVSTRTVDISPVVPPIPVPPPAPAVSKVPPPASPKVQPPPPAAVVVQSKPAVAPAPVPVPLPAVPPAPPAPPPATLKPLPSSAPTSFKDTWVDALPTPKPVETPGHPLPPPGGWPAAHISRPAPTAYVTSGVVIFPDDLAPLAKPVAKTKAPTEHAPAPAPVAQPVSRIQPPSPPAPVAQPVSRIQPPSPPAPVAQPVSRIQPPSPPVPMAQPVSRIQPPPAPLPAVAPASHSTVTVPVHTAPPSAATLKSHVEQVCGRLVRQVEVVSTGTGLTVRVRCADEATAKKVTERVLVQVPEMSDPKVNLEVNVGQ